MFHLQRLVKDVEEAGRVGQMIEVDGPACEIGEQPGRRAHRRVRHKDAGEEARERCRRAKRRLSDVREGRTGLARMATVAGVQGELVPQIRRWN